MNRLNDAFDWHESHVRGDSCENVFYFDGIQVDAKGD